MLFIHSVWFVSILGGLLMVVVGRVWFSPRMCGTRWLVAIARTPQQQEYASAHASQWLLVTFLLGTILSYSVASMMTLYKVDTWYDVLSFVILVWGGYSMPLLGFITVWEHKRLPYFLIIGGYWLVMVASISSITMFLL